MKVLLGAAVVGLMLGALPVAAQTTPETPAAAASSCAAPTAKPTLPDGAGADRAEMEAGNTLYVAWANAYHASLACQRAEIDALRAQLQARSTAFNEAANELNASNGSWEAEVAEYNEHNPSRRSTVRAGRQN